ncbi:hypothetical protein MMUC44124_01115 [Mycolicibacterium mucogenicum DSM 44124]|nr:hypothetical protein MMUC44124_01115 [Mycolicibacterium mucogenicum DSM 44124]
MATIGAAAVLASGCTPTLNAGVIEGKDHYPESVAMIPQYTTTCSGNPPVCSVQMIGMIPVVTPEAWTLHLRDGDKTGDHNVTPDEFAKYQVRERYP